MRLFLIVSSFFLFIFTTPSHAQVGGYRKATDGDDVVKNRLFVKKKRFEIDIPSGGILMNQSYIDSYLVGGNLNYFFSESWGMSLGGVYALNTDRQERLCVESFYNDPKLIAKEVCDKNGTSYITKGGEANYGPAYVPIRQINYMVLGSAIWNPVYGKQIIWLSATNHFDLYVNFGGGLAFSTFYPQSTTLLNGQKSRGALPGSGADVGERASNGRLLYGTEGRPASQSQSTLVVNAGLGQKYHVAKNFHLKLEFQDYLLLGTASNMGFDNYLGLLVGMGLRF